MEVSQDAEAPSSSGCLFLEEDPNHDVFVVLLGVGGVGSSLTRVGVPASEPFWLRYTSIALPITFGSMIEPVGLSHTTLARDGFCSTLVGLVSSIFFSAKVVFSFSSANVTTALAFFSSSLLKQLLLAIGWCLLMNQFEASFISLSVFTSVLPSGSKEISKLLDLEPFSRERFNSRGLGFAPSNLHKLWISCADDVKEDMIEIRSVLEQTIPLPEVEGGGEGTLRGWGISEALRRGGIGGGIADKPVTSENLLDAPWFCWYLEDGPPSSGCTSQMLSWFSFCHIFKRTFLALTSAMSSMMSSCRLKLLPVMLEEESRRDIRPGNAAMDSRLLRPKMREVGGAREMVTTEWRRPPAWGAGAWDSVARNAASIVDGPLPSAPPCSDKRRTCTEHVKSWISVNSTIFFLLLM